MATLLEKKLCFFPIFCTQLLQGADPRITKMIYIVGKEKHQLNCVLVLSK